MARFLALEWDSREARVAVATMRGNDVLVEEALCVPLPVREEGKGPPEAAEVAEKVNAALSARSIRRGEVLVALARSSVELKQLSFPPVPDDELPDMVRWQATREFHSLGDDWPLDFLPLTGGADEQRTVLAAAISPELVAQIQQVCNIVGLKADRVVLRPCAAASLFLRRPEAREQQVRLIVDLESDEADLTVLSGSDVVFLRTARLPHDVLSTVEAGRPLVAEIRRTMAAAHNQLGSKRIEAIYFCGTQAQHGALVQRLEQDLSLPTKLFDPLAGLQVESSLKARLPENIGRFAALLGMLADELEGVPHGLDFLHPRKKPNPPSKRNTYALAGTAVACLAAAVLGLVWMQLASMDKQIAQLTAQSTSLDPAVKEAKSLKNAVDQVEKWAVNDVNWLEELERFSQKFPQPKDAMLTHLRLNATHPKGGVIQAEGLVRDAAVFPTLEEGLQDGRHTVQGNGREYVPDNKKYLWKFNGDVVVNNTAEAPAPANRAPSPAPAEKATTAAKVAGKTSEKK